MAIPKSKKGRPKPAWLRRPTFRVSLPFPLTPINQHKPQPNILKSYANRSIDYRYCVSYYRGKDKLKRKENGETVELESEIDFIIEENGMLYPIEIKKNTSEKAIAASAFTILDKVPEKKRDMGAVISMCPQPGQLRENVLEIPVWYI